MVRGSGCAIFAAPAVLTAATVESAVDEALDGADMIFVTTGLGGGTGTGAAPVIASLASELGALTVAVVTKLFKFEVNRRQIQADRGPESVRDDINPHTNPPPQGGVGWGAQGGGGGKG